MKIMYLLFSFTIGGTERLIVDICNEMSLKEEIHLFIVNNLIDDELIKSLNKKIRIKLLRRKVGKVNKVLAMIELVKYIKKNKIEIIHCNSFNAPELLILSKILNIKCKIVSTIHGMEQFNNISKFRIILKNLICDCFIGISDAVKEDIIKSGILQKKVIKLYNGIDVKKYECAKYKLLDKENIVIGCIARFVPEIKGQDLLIKAVNILKNDYPNILVLFAGGITKDQQINYKNMQNYIEKNNLNSNIKFLGNVSDIPNFLNTIDICVVPSRSEGFGLSLLEALSMGIPTIASNIAGPRELILNENVGVLFESGNFQSLAFEIKKVLSQFDKIKKETWLKKDFIKKNYSIRKMCNDLVELYNKIK